MSRIFREIERRGLVKGATSNIEKVMASGGHIYGGFDPTATSLHIGNLAMINTLNLLHGMGVQATAVVGEFTGYIGDPSGKSEERKLLEADEIVHNTAAITQQLRRLLHNDIPIYSNMNWLQSYSVMDFMRDTGRHLRMSQLLGKEVVKSRLSSKAGLSYLEFSYQAFQATDFMMLYRNHGVNMQVGGADQWGNIVAGIDLIKRSHNLPDDHLIGGFTIPLLTDKSGAKLGKSAGNAIWLDEHLISPFDFYQYFLRCSDDTAQQCLYSLTSLPIEDIEDAIAKHKQNPKEKELQRVLAASVTGYVFPDHLDRVQDLTASLYHSGDWSHIPSEHTVVVSRSQAAASLPEICKLAGICTSLREFRTLWQQNAITILEGADQSDIDINRPLSLKGDRLVLRRGKKLIKSIIFSAE